MSPRQKNAFIISTNPFTIIKVLVIGATGNTGSLVVDRLLEGHEVTAFARRLSALSQTADRLRVVQGLP